MLSLVVIAWNEESTLARCLTSVKGLVDEIVVVVDEASTDQTLKIAKSHGSKVFSHPHTRIVEPIRNFAINKASGDWILVLDADEEVSPELSQSIKDVISQNKYSYVRIPRKNIIFNKWITSEHWWPDYVYRLFKKGSVTWQDAIHSAPQLSGEGLDLTADDSHALTHHNYQSIGQYLDRLNRYTDIQSEELINKKAVFIWSKLITQPTGEFLRNYFARNGYKDGLHGLALALLQAFSELVVWLKLWQASGFSEKSVSSKELSKTFLNTSKEFIWWTDELKIKSSTPLVRPVIKLIRKMKQV